MKAVKAEGKMKIEMSMIAERIEALERVAYLAVGALRDIRDGSAILPAALYAKNVLSAMSNDIEKSQSRNEETNGK